MFTEARVIKYDIENFYNLFSEIGYAFEPQYPPRKQTVDELEVITFYKLSLRSDGQAQYKAETYTFNPKLWSKVEALYKLLEGESES